jgi:hypothetical protein
MSETSASSGLDDMIKQDRVRYERKGYGLVFGVIFALSFFLLGPEVARYIWPALEGYSGTSLPKSKASQRFCIIMIPAHLVTYVLANVMMYLIYIAKHPFFERYKILDVIVCEYVKAALALAKGPKSMEEETLSSGAKLAHKRYDGFRYGYR